MVVRLGKVVRSSFDALRVSNMKFVTINVDDSLCEP